MRLNLHFSVTDLMSDPGWWRELLIRIADIAFR